MTSTTAEPSMSLDAETTRKGYARPEALVTTEWLAAHLDDPSIRILESERAGLQEAFDRARLDSLRDALTRSNNTAGVDTIEHGLSLHRAPDVLELPRRAARSGDDLREHERADDGRAAFDRRAT